MSKTQNGIKEDDDKRKSSQNTPKTIDWATQTQKPEMLLILVLCRWVSIYLSTTGNHQGDHDKLHLVDKSNSMEKRTGLRTWT